MSHRMTPKMPADRSLCGWATCQAQTDGHPLCEEHLRKAWAIVQARLNADQRFMAAVADAQEVHGGDVVDPHTGEAVGVFVDCPLHGEISKPGSTLTELIEQHQGCAR